MGNLVLAGATSGSTTISPTDTVTITCTLPSTGGTIQTSGAGFTTNGVAYASSTSALTTGSALTFDGTNLGIGTTPTSKLSINGGSASTDVRLQNTASGVGAGNGMDVGIGSTGDNGYMYLYENGYIYWATNATERMRLDASGNLLVGQTSANSFNLTTGFGFDVRNPYGLGVAVQSNPCVIFNRNTSTGTIVEIRYNGTAVGSISYNGTITAYNTTSDYRLKTVVGVLTGHGARIDALEPIEYTWNSNGSRSRGFLAHKFQEVYADSVTGTKDAVNADGNPVYQEMQASSAEVIADLVAEIQSLRQRLSAANL